MGQSDICDLLLKEKKPLTRNQIAEKLNEDKNKVSRIICTLLIHNEIKCIEIDRLKARELGEEYKNLKRRLRVYYI